MQAVFSWYYNKICRGSMFAAIAMNRTKTYLSLFIAVIIYVNSAAAKITKAKIRKDDRSLILMAEPFGFGQDGWINITVSNFALRQLYDVNKGRPVGRPNLDRCKIFHTNLLDRLGNLQKQQSALGILI